MTNVGLLRGERLIADMETVLWIAQAHVTSNLRSFVSAVICQYENLVTLRRQCRSSVIDLAAKRMQRCGDTSSLIPGRDDNTYL